MVFLGKSYVSPDLGATLLYDDFPTLPGYQTDHVADVKGSDIGAIAWQDLTFTVTQRSALLQGELPLWNRYNSCGTALLGQGQSMFGDPLHFIPILANSAAWSWDLKYLIAKWLFAFGLGLCVWAVARHLPAALLTVAARAVHRILRLPPQPSGVFQHVLCAVGARHVAEFCRRAHAARRRRLARRPDARQLDPAQQRHGQGGLHAAPLPEPRRRRRAVHGGAAVAGAPAAARGARRGPARCSRF